MNPYQPQESYPAYENAQSQGLLQVSFINKVYGAMTLALAITAGVAHYTYINASIETLANIYTPCIIAELVLVFLLSFAALKLPVFIAAIAFLGYSVLNGITLSAIFHVYKMGSIAIAFFSTAGTFGAMTIYGATTKRDLTGIGNLCFMGLIGVIIASLLNFFFKSTGLEYLLSYLTLAIFIGLTAYDTQKIKQIGESGINHSGLAIVAALSLYLDFINMFLTILRLFGRRK
jgi:FtsH-binding integral membrane protein